MALTKLNFSGSGLSSLPNGSVIQTVSANKLDNTGSADFDANFENFIMSDRNFH